MQIPYRKPPKYSQYNTDPLMTEEKYLELKTEQDMLINYSRPNAAADVTRLAELGDFSENMEYQLAKGKLRGINTAIMRLEKEINSAELIKKPKAEGIIQIGSTVTVECDGNQKTYIILGSAETDPTRGVISHLSPLGTALIGHKKNDVVQIKLTTGENNYKITNID